MGDDFLDLAEAVERGALDEERAPDPPPMRERYVVGLGRWELMLGDLLAQVAADAGSVDRALLRLGMPSLAQVDAWERDAAAGFRASVRWASRRHAKQQPRRDQAWVQRRRDRGDSYLDLAEAARRGALPGDGKLDPARLRPRYTVDAGPWLGMVADLLAQVVGDAGSLERAATVLAVPRASLAAWVRWLVAGGSAEAADSRWPTSPANARPDGDAYVDLAEAVERGALDGDGEVDPPQVREFYVVELDEWGPMTNELLMTIIGDAGSVRQAARVLGVPRSTLTAWVSRRKG